MSAISVYVGRWYDYSYSGALGDTVTLPLREGNILISALTTFVTIVGACFWSILAFALHQWRAEDGDTDGVRQQHQIILRNSGSPWGAVTLIFQACWAWRSKKPVGSRVEKLKRRSILLALLPLVVLSGFTTIGIFVSQVARGTNVRIQSGACGFWGFDAKTNEGRADFQLKLTNDTQAGRAYAQRCYVDATLPECSLFQVPKLPYTKSDVDCPFGKDPSGTPLCLTKALQLDTGTLDSDAHFGINTAEANRVQFRKSVACSPINITSYLDPLSLANTTTFLQYNLGPIAGISNSTYLYNKQARGDLTSYQLTTLYTQDGYGNIWTPTPALNVSDSDVSLFLLAQNSVKYLSPVTDAWFASNNAINQGLSGPNDLIYGPDAFVTAMACIDQLQVCNKGTSVCTILSSFNDTRFGAREIGLNEYQSAVASRLLQRAAMASTYGSVYTLGEAALLARNRLVGNFQGLALAPNQWQLEAEGWFQTALAKMQAYVLEYAANNMVALGPNGHVVAPSPANASDAPFVDMCANVRVHNKDGYQSFSFLGIMVVVCVGSFIILVSLCAEPLVELKRKRWNAKPYREVTRNADRSLQLHRMAVEGRGHGTWENQAKEVPILGKYELIPVPVKTGQSVGYP